MPSVSDGAIRELSNTFKLLSDETRLRILFYLAQNQELHVTDLCDRLGQSQPAVSHHLALLRVSGLIEPRREGKHNYYSVRTETFGELLVSLFASMGEVPKKIKFHNFVLTSQRALNARTPGEVPRVRLRTRAASRGRSGSRRVRKRTRVTRGRPRSVRVPLCFPARTV